MTLSTGAIASRMIAFLISGVFAPASFQATRWDRSMQIFSVPCFFISIPTHLQAGKECSPHRLRRITGSRFSQNLIVLWLRDRDNQRKVFNIPG